MSEKMTAEKREFILTLEDQKKNQITNEEKMEQGKIEIMKVVEGVQGAEKLSELIERGKKKGKLSSSELMDVLENLDLDALTEFKRGSNGVIELKFADRARLLERLLDAADHSGEEQVDRFLRAMEEKEG